MTIELKLTPELESRIRRQAELAGRDVDNYVLDLLSEQLKPTDVDVSPEVESSDEDWAIKLRAWANSFPPVSHLLDDSRESIYEDRN